ncbi:MAG: DUF2071 domain-containing protein [Pirellula sp.]|jgi:hypothetical protein|nr:DUF2071 domain-containing protein [Pirellula sp.]
MIDRSLNNRPLGPNSGTQIWRDLLFLHWKIPTEELRPLVPKELEIDTYDGQSFVALVPFRMCEICPPWLPKRLAFTFFETNVRTYVLHKGKPGVYFFSLDASSRLAVWAARLGWSLPYYYAKMQSESRGELRTYRCTRGHVRSLVEFSPSGDLETAKPGTMEHFLLERYVLFVKRSGIIYSGTVHHAPYSYQPSIVNRLDDSLVANSGLKLPKNMPDLAHYSPGVNVEVFRIAPD